MGDEHKPETVSSSSLIRVGGTNFFNMRSVNDLVSAEASAPDFHRRALNGLKASGKVRDDSQQYQPQVSERVQVRSRRSFDDGSRVRNAEGKKLTIIHA